MYALRSTTQRTIAPAARRFASAAAAPKNKLVPDVYQYSFKKSWLSDPSTYPLVAVMTLATSVMVGMSANALLRYKGVKISTERKNAILNEWDSPSQRQTTVTDVIGSHPVGMNASKFRSLRHGGLGAEEWNKQ